MLIRTFVTDVCFWHQNLLYWYSNRFLQTGWNIAHEELRVLHAHSSCVCKSICVWGRRVCGPACVQQLCNVLEPCTKPQTASVCKLPCKCLCGLDVWVPWSTMMSTGSQSSTENKFLYVTNTICKSWASEWSPPISICLRPRLDRWMSFVSFSHAHDFVYSLIATDPTFREMTAYLSTLKAGKLCPSRLF